MSDLKVDGAGLAQAGPAFVAAAGHTGGAVDVVSDAVAAVFAAVSHPGVTAGVDTAGEAGRRAGRKLAAGLYTSGGFCQGSAGSFHDADQALADTAERR